jgi:hypothetical protein
MRSFTITYSCILKFVASTEMIKLTPLHVSIHKALAQNIHQKMDDDDKH